MLVFVILSLVLYCTVGSEAPFDSPAVYQVTDPVDHAECPTWDSRRNLLFFVDIHAGRIFSYDHQTKELRNITLYGEVAPVVLSEKDSNLLIVGLNRSVVAVQWDGKGHLQRHRILTTVANDKPTSRMNDGKADKEGRLWFGTMGYEDTAGNLTPNDGTLYKIDKDHIENPIPIIQPVNISNGLAWNKANNKFYYIDTPTYKIVSYNYNNTNGEISNRTVVFDLRLNNITGGPDGMTIDKDDNLWIALYGGGSVIKVDPRTRRLLQRVAIPAEAVTSVMWGGQNLDILFVTTSRYTLTKEQRGKQPAAGSLFAVTNTGTSGVPMFYADIIDHI